MTGLPKRLIRSLVYFISFLFIAAILLLIANKHEYIEIANFIPESFLSKAPSYFQPPSDSFIVDISISNCFRINKNGESCGVPNADSGVLGDVGKLGGWSRINKDIALDKSWVRQQFFAYKKVSHKSLSQFLKETNNKDEVIIDIAVANPKEDSKIKGNTLMLPKYIIRTYGKTDIYADEEEAEEDLIQEEAGEKLNDITQEKLEEEKEKENEDTAITEEERVKEEGKIAKEEEAKEDKKKEEIENEAEKVKNTEKLKEFEKGTSPKEFEEKIGPQVPTVDEIKDKEPLVANEEQEKEEKEKENDDKPIQKPVKKRQDTQIKREADPSSRYIPTKEEVASAGWRQKSNGIWLRYGSHSTKNPITGIDLLFGHEAVDPRPNWTLLKNPLRGLSNPSDIPVFITFRRGPKLDYKKKYPISLKLKVNDKFKILQVADLHFATGYGKCRDPSPQSTGGRNCRADARTLKFLNKVLDIEKPDFVVLTGDQIFGDNSPDSESAVFKALNPFIERKIPFAVTMGNHDDEGSLSRDEVMALSVDLPYSVSAVGPVEIDGVGNYVVTVEGKSSKETALAFYFLDTHKYSPNNKVFPGYDWIKDNQLNFVLEEYASLKSSIESYGKTSMSMAFFHIPLPEYRNFNNQPFIGENREGVTAPYHNSGARDTLAEIGVKVVSVGHDHCNDYCLMDTQTVDSTQNQMWLCYGGGVGEGGYGGYGGYVRRLRIFELDTDKGEIKSWKRREDDPVKIIDEQILVTGGELVNW
ncbi:DCR2 [[Candida] subhashii]|uniref:DCR2 n=1 Tax=[Candida] subhashii TaxID=561895 RepID=A0A8J5QIQ0_9ASCO|nr:DCR2 [[Candida] subhashii]KAG7665391.1 DCR2 [[Candida] subhashii]